jgi:predicted esterase
VTSIASLSGFLPGGFVAFTNKAAADGVKVFIAHGSKDELVPIESAREAATALREAGADVTYCESDVGHKLSTECFQALGKFYKGFS